jgi:hypothetical protein
MQDDKIEMFHEESELLSSFQISKRDKDEISI